jgi:transcription elongation factor GreA
MRHGQAASIMRLSLKESLRCVRMVSMSDLIPDEEILLTPEGRDRLKAELDYLRSVKRPRIAEQLRQAIDAGDITENVGYEDAKHEQGFVEGRILTLETLLRHAMVVEAGESSETVAFGSRVTVLERGGGTENFQIVSSVEVDPANGRISNESPLGKALLDHRVGEEVAVETPDGIIYFEIVDIQ